MFVMVCRWRADSFRFLSANQPLGVSKCSFPSTLNRFYLAQQWQQLCSRKIWREWKKVLHLAALLVLLFCCHTSSSWIQLMSFYGSSSMPTIWWWWRDLSVKKFFCLKPTVICFVILCSGVEFSEAVLMCGEFNVFGDEGRQQFFITYDELSYLGFPGLSHKG